MADKGENIILGLMMMLHLVQMLRIVYLESKIEALSGDKDG